MIEDDIKSHPWSNKTPLERLEILKKLSEKYGNVLSDDVKSAALYAHEKFMNDGESNG